MMKEVLPFPV